ncbi:MAG: hypothetical protein HC936_11400 [Leptolyngbyaceae cyanobacterium SU_3_3]|nr:hypothetical protein [Leptolyngbyaceae cyanobacterium SU_3_3]
MGSVLCINRGLIPGVSRAWLAIAYPIPSVPSCGITDPVLSSGRLWRLCRS